MPEYTPFAITQSSAQLQTALDKVGTTALTTTATDLSGAVNELDGEVGSNTTAINTNAVNIGSLANLTTSNKTSLVGAINEVGAVANGKVSPLTYTTDISLNGEFDERPTSASTETYTFTDNGWLYIYATRGTASGNTLQVLINGTVRFGFPAYEAYAVVDMLIPVVAGQELKFTTDSASATWTLRKVNFMQ